MYSGPIGFLLSIGRQEATHLMGRHRCVPASRLVREAGPAAPVSQQMNKTMPFVA